MDNLTLVIPFFNGHEYIYNLLSDIPAEMPVVIVDDQQRERAGYRDWETDRKSTRLNSSHRSLSRMPSSA